jgi:hypothetical protein
LYDFCTFNSLKLDQRKAHNNNRRKGEVKMKKKLLSKVVLFAFVLAQTAPAAYATNIKDPMTFERGVEFQSTVQYGDTAYTYPTTDGTASYYLQTDGSGTLSWASVSGSGDNTLDDAYDEGGAGAGKKIEVDSGAVELEVDDASNNGALLLDMDDVTNNPDVLTITNAGSGADIVAPSYSLTAGAVSAASGAYTGALSSAGLTATGVVSLGNGSTTAAVNSSTWDISTTGAISGVSTMSLSGDITFANGQAIQSSTTTAETIAIQGYDVDNTTYRDTISLTNGNTIAAAVGTGNETVAVNSTTWDVSTAGAFTGVADITGTAGAAMNVTIASDGAADDLTLSVTGATDSSVHVASAGTGEDAISLQASAGGIDIDGLAAKNVDIAGGQVLISSKDDAGSAIALTTNVGTSETIVVTNTQGTGDAALDINATAGGIDVDAAKSIAMTSSEAQADAVTLAASAGGVDITSAATFDIDVTATGGTVQVIASEAAANQFKVDAQGTIAGNAIVLETTDGGIQLNADNAANGDIAIDAADDMTLTAGGDLTLAVTGTVSAGSSSITDVMTDFENVAAANTIAATECGKTFFLNDATEFQSILPTAASLGGCVMRFVVGAAPSGASYTVVTGNSLENLIYGLAVVNGASVAAAAEDTITFADGAAVKGDWVELTNDDTSWYVSGQGSAAGAITLTQAD